jgi:glutaredoxin-dependent peroxiredoxin
MALQIGDYAPDFTLVNTDKQEVTLSQYRGKNVLLLFFPFAFTGTCTEELCSVRDNIGDYEGVNAEVIGISVDSPFALKKFKEEYNYNFPLISDFNKIVSITYGAFYEEFVLGLKGVSKRSAFVIDAEGKIRYAEVLDKAGDIPNFAAINDTLKSLI